MATLTLDIFVMDALRKSKSNGGSKCSKSSKKVRFSEDTKKHDGQNATTTAFGEFFEQTLMQGKRPSQAMALSKIAPHAVAVIKMIEIWLSEYDAMWEKHPSGILDPHRQVSAFSKKMVRDTEDDFWVSEPKTFKCPVIKQGGSSCNLALRGLGEHRALLTPIKKWLKKTKLQRERKALIRSVAMKRKPVPLTRRKPVFDIVQAINEKRGIPKDQQSLKFTGTCSP